jgi:hypothetical protein
MLSKLRKLHRRADKDNLANFQAGHTLIDILISRKEGAMQKVQEEEKVVVHLAQVASKG